MYFADRLGLSVPLIQASMAGVFKPVLAAVVANQVALGSIRVGATEVASTRTMIEEVRAHTDRAFNVNLFVHGGVKADWRAKSAGCNSSLPCSRSSRPSRLDRCGKSKRAWPMMPTCWRCC